MAPKRKNIISMGDSDEFDEEEELPTRTVSTRQSAPTFAAAENRPQRAAAAKAVSEVSAALEEEEDELAGSDEAPAADDMDVDDDEAAFIDDEEEDELDELQSEEDYDDDDISTSKKAKAPAKLKLKSGDKTSAKPAAVRKLQSQSRKSGGGAKAKKPKAKADEMVLDDDDEEEPPDEGDDFETSSNVSEGSSNPARMTARQRGAALGADASGEGELLSLPLDAPRSRDRFAGLAPDDAAKKRTAAQKRRKAQADRKLEEEKADTINRLLNRQKGVPGRRGRKAKNAPPDEVGPNGEAKPAPVKQVKAAPPPPAPTQLRYVQSATQSVLNVPVELAHLYVAQPARAYPGPRPQPPTRRLVQT